MKCSKCGYENPVFEKNCFRCNALLGQDKIFSKSSQAGSFPGDILKHRPAALESKDFNPSLKILPPIAASFLMPGIGQWLNGSIWKALFFLSVYIFLLYREFSFLFSGIPGEVKLHFARIKLAGFPLHIILLHAISMTDAYAGRIKMSRGRKITVKEATAVAAVSVFFIWLLIFASDSILNMKTGDFSRYSLYRNQDLDLEISDMSVKPGDFLFVDWNYYSSYPVEFGHMVTDGPRGVQEMAPGLVVALPGEVIRGDGKTIVAGTRKLPVHSVRTGEIFFPEIRAGEGEYILVNLYSGCIEKWSAKDFAGRIYVLSR